MSLFCFLWAPLFYLFRRSLGAGEGGAGSVLALLLGSLAAILQFFIGSLVDPGGFGLSRWVSGFVDIVAIPALVPILVCLLFTALRLLSGTPDFANFALLWLIPAGALRSISWSSLGDPVLLVLVPLLWTAIALGLPFFLASFAYPRPPIIVLSILAMAVLLVLAAASYWAFFSQKNLLGFCLLAAVLTPAVVSIVRSAVKAT
jgi:hypothetical protein